jgi:hypothetical protein
MSETLITGADNTDTSADTQQIADTTTTDTTAAADQQTQTQSTDTDKTDTTNEGDKGDQGKADDKSGAPEQYEFKAQEGLQFDEQVIEAYSEVAKELNLSNDDAQKLLDKVAPVMAARQQEQIKAVVDGWSETARTDKEFGGEKLSENLATAKKALDAFGTPELKTLLNESGLGNNPEVIRFMYRAGKQISEDKFVGGKGPSGSDKSLADKLYSNQK